MKEGGSDGIYCYGIMCGMMGGHEGHSAADTEKKHKDSGIENHEPSGNHQDAEVKVETEMQKKRCR